MIPLVRRVIRVNESKTSVRLSSFEWQAFDDLCAKEHISRTSLINLLAKAVTEYQNLTAVIRIFTLIYYVALSSDSSRAKRRTPDLSNIFNIIGQMR